MILIRVTAPHRRTKWIEYFSDKNFFYPKSDSRYRLSPNIITIVSYCTLYDTILNKLLLYYTAVKQTIIMYNLYI